VSLSPVLSDRGPYTNTSSFYVPKFQNMSIFHK